ncbi:hypothetical protein P7C73_g172, partial [Tremellales sp. Uapishka_1]
MRLITPLLLSSLLLLPELVVSRPGIHDIRVKDLGSRAGQFGAGGQAGGAGAGGTKSGATGGVCRLLPCLAADLFATLIQAGAGAGKGAAAGGGAAAAGKGGATGGNAAAAGKGAGAAASAAGTAANAGGLSTTCPTTSPDANQSGVAAKGGIGGAAAASASAATASTAAAAAKGKGGAAAASASAATASTAAAAHGGKGGAASAAAASASAASAAGAGKGGAAAAAASSSAAAASAAAASNATVVGTAGPPVPTLVSNGGDTINKASLLDTVANANPAILQAASAVSNNNFLSFCDGNTITDGKQITGGSCNPVPMGQATHLSHTEICLTNALSHQANMATIKAGETFDIDVASSGLDTGSFTDAAADYYAGPQQVNPKTGNTIGHIHVVVEQMQSLTSTALLNPNKFAFFKGIDGEANGMWRQSSTQAALFISILSDSAGNLDGYRHWRVDCWVLSNMYDQLRIESSVSYLLFYSSITYPMTRSVVMPIAQRGAENTCSYFTVA